MDSNENKNSSFLKKAKMWKSVGTAKTSSNFEKNAEY